MKRLFAALSLVTLLVAPLATPAMADDLDFSQIKCSDFVQVTKDDAVLMLTWLEGYFTPKNDRPIMQAKKAASDGTNIHTYCLAHGDVDVFSAAKAVMSGK